MNTGRLRALVPAPLERPLNTTGAVVERAQEQNLTYLAAGLAYYAFVSIIPLLLLAVAAASVLGGEAFASRVTGMLSEQLSTAGQESINGALTAETGRRTASIVGLLTLAWSALKLFRGLDQAFAELYGATDRSSLLGQLRDAIVVVLGIGSAIGLIVGVAILRSRVSVALPGTRIASTLVLFVVLTVTLLPVFYVLPPSSVSVRGVLPGTLLAAGGWIALQLGFRVYAANASRYAAYGLIGAILLFVTWLYFASIVVLLGATINAVRKRDRETVA